MNTLFSSPLLPFLLLLLLMAISINTSPSASCTDVLVEISPCLPYISSPPNDLSTNASRQCCDFYNLSFINGTSPCLCYLLSRQLILGFPLNSTRISSLASLCTTNTSRNLDKLCNALPTLPPLGAASISKAPAPAPAPTTGPGPSPSPSRGLKDSPSPSPSPSKALESAANSPSPASSSPAFSTDSSSSTSGSSPSSSGVSNGSPTQEPARNSACYNSRPTTIAFMLLLHLGACTIL